MDPNSSLRKICLGDDAIVISSNKAEGSGDWNSPEYQDTTGSKGKKVMNALSFYKIETDEVSERYIEPCFVNGLEAYDGEINLAFDENLISNEYAAKLCLDYMVKKGKKLIKKKLIVALKGELYFVKFIINPEEDDVEPRVILGRSFMRLPRGIVDFENEVITIYPKLEPFEDDSEKTERSLDDWDQLLYFNFDDVPDFREELPPLVCKIGKSNRNKKRSIEILSSFYQDIRPSLSAGDHSTQEEAAKEALAIRTSQNFALLEEVRHVIETITYHDKYKKILDEIWKDKVELDGKIVKEEEEATMGTHDDEAGSSRSKCSRHETMEEVLLPQVHHEFFMGRIRYDGEIDDMLRIRLREAGSDEEIFTSVELGLYQAAELDEEGFNVYFEGVYCRDLDMTTLREFINSESRLIPEDPQPGVPRVGIPRPPRASM
nr:hypothetical protein [Tanacetum cinerariifolium]